MRFPDEMHEFLRKRRTRQHVIADLAVNHVERHVLLAGHVVEKQWFDYGIDLVMKTFNRRGEVEAGTIYFQVKATDRLRRLADQTGFSFTLQLADLRLWLNEPAPVFVIIYDVRQEKAFWIHVQSYFAATEDASLPTFQTSINVRFRDGDELTAGAIKHFRRVLLGTAR